MIWSSKSGSTVKTVFISWGYGAFRGHRAVLTMPDAGSHIYGTGAHAARHGAACIHARGVAAGAVIASSPGPWQLLKHHPQVQLMECDFFNP